MLLDYTSNHLINFVVFTRYKYEGWSVLLKYELWFDVLEGIMHFLYNFLWLQPLLHFRSIVWQTRIVLRLIVVFGFIVNH